MAMMMTMMMTVMMAMTMVMMVMVGVMMVSQAELARLEATDEAAQDKPSAASTG